MSDAAVKTDVSNGVSSAMSEHFLAKLWLALAGAAGATTTLTQMKHLTPWQAFSTVFVGLVCAVYLTPLILLHHWLHDAPAEAHLGAAFLVGVTSMGLLGGMITFSQRFSKDPVGTLKGVFTGGSKK